jgi:signal transduction histidine kinase
MKSIAFSQLKLLPGEKLKKVEFAYDNIYDKPVIIHSDAARLTQILTNLLDNAIKFTEEGYIKFGYVENKADIVFYVKDSGIGIKKENIPNIFDRFTKIDDNINITYLGTCIGLSIAKKKCRVIAR